MKKILIFLFVLFCIAFGLWYFDNVEAQKLDIYGEVYFTDTDPDSPTFGQEMAVFATQGLTVDPAREIIDSNTEKIAENKYKIYSGVPQFIDQGDYWSEIDYQYLEKTEYDSIYKNVEVISFIQTALAQSVSPAIDGFLGHFTGSNWATVHDSATSTQATYETANDYLFLVKGGASSQIARGVLGFNLTALSGTVSSASIRFNVTTVTNTDNDGLDYFNVYEATLANNTTLAVGDYDGFGSTKFISDIDLTSWGTGSKNLDLNASGLSFLTTKLGSNANLMLREGHDIENNEPIADYNLINIDFSEQTGTANDPVLIVELTAGETGGSTISYASSSFTEIDVATTIIRDSMYLFLTGFIFSIWYFRKRNKRIF